jgi:hypothetical protein
MIITLYAKQYHELVKVDEIDTDNVDELNEMIDYILEMSKKGIVPAYEVKETEA